MALVFHNSYGRYFIVSLRMLLGVVFLASATLKLFPLEAFEFLLMQQTSLSWDLIPAISRWVILMEWSLGLLLLTRFSERIWSVIALLVLIGFSVYLLQQVVSGDDVENCGCFGELIPLTPMQSLMKNLVLIGIAIPASLRVEIKCCRSWVFLPLIYILGIVLLFTNPVPQSAEYATTEQNSTDWLATLESELETDLSSGQHVVLVMYSGCIHCQRLAQSIGLLRAEDISIPLHLCVYGNQTSAMEFIEQNNLSHLDAHFVSSRPLFEEIEGIFPSLILVNEGRLQLKWKGGGVEPALVRKAVSGDLQLERIH